MTVLRRGFASAATLGLLAVLAPGAASADPCHAIPGKGAMPAYLAKGRTFSGPVVYVGDGDSLCVARGPEPAQWVEVRLADFYAPELNGPGGREAKRALERIAKGRHARCTAQKRSYDRVVAKCAIGGVSIGELMRAEGVAEGGEGR